MLSGQPGKPNDIITGGQLATILDKYATKHSGIAPIVVIPDQLGSAKNNPMCVDSPLGNSQTYLTVDVVNWIQQNLAVSTEAKNWSIGGFSQGATCASQLSMKFSNIYGNAIVMSGQLEPTMGDGTLAKAFNGSAEKYDAEKPINLLEQNAPYLDSYLIIGAGQNDKEYVSIAEKISSAAKQAGINTTLLEIPNTGHDWFAATQIFETGINIIGQRQGIK